MKARTYCSVLAAVLAATACQPNNAARVTVNYRQLGNFPEYSLTPDGSAPQGAGDGIFVLYKVKSISNTGAQAKAFTFDPHKVATITSDKTSNETVDVSNSLLAGLNLATVSVPAGQTKTVNRCFIKRVLTSTPQSLATQSGHVSTIYQIDKSQPVLMQDMAPNASVAVGQIVIPDALQQMCANN
jgi:hypothetical protein